MIMHNYYGKRKVIPIILFVCIAFGLCSCANDGNQATEDTNGGNQVVGEDSGTMTAFVGSYPTTIEKIQCSITNTSNLPISFGHQYRVERWDKNKWVTFAKPEAVDDWEATLELGETWNEDIWLLQEAHVYHEGLYRIRKEYYDELGESEKGKPIYFEFYLVRASMTPNQ
jgi:hypothetical protein